MSIASSFIRIKVASSSVLAYELRSPKTSRLWSYSAIFSTAKSNSFICLRFCLVIPPCCIRSFIRSTRDENSSVESVLSSIASLFSASMTCSISRSTASVFSLRRASYFSTLPRHTNEYLFAADSIFVPSIYCTCNDTKPSLCSSSTICVNKVSKHPLRRLPRK